MADIKVIGNVFFFERQGKKLATALLLMLSGII